MLCLGPFVREDTFVERRVRSQVSGGHVTPLEEGPEAGDDFVETNVGVEGGLDVGEQDERAIGSSTTV